MDIRQSSLWAKYLEELGWQTHPLTPTSFAYSKKIPVMGTIVKIPRVPLPLPLKQIDAVVKENNVFFVKLEPAIETKQSKLDNILSLIENSGFRGDRWPLSPTRTIKIDLTKSEDELLRNMEKDTRYNVRLAQRRGVMVKQTDDIEEFKTLYYATAKRKGFWPAKKEIEVLWKIFHKGGSAAILTAYYNNEALASSLLLFSEKAGYYQHAASVEGHRDVMAPYLLLWEAMRFLKKKGCKTLDLEGIHDPRIHSTRNWKGFTLFKRGFGGEEVEYIGSFVKYPKLWSKILFFPSRFF
ncbi:MAG: peptidoglycan bridge formation glycyltransferase FemA/FemB family protein [Candidatus Woykebacteria bacterium]